MNLFSLLEAASKRLKQNDPDFQRQTETTVAILRASGVLPIKRASVNGAIHHLLCAAIVEAYDNNTSVDITSRSAGISRPQLLILDDFANVIMKLMER